jgi:AraC-like DNA-binding protein
MAAPETSSSSAWVRGITDLFAACGVDRQQLFDGAGIAIERLQSPHSRFTSAEINRLWRLAVDSTGNPALALDRTLAERHINMDIPAQAMWPGPHLLAGVQGLSRYLELTADAAAFSVEPGEGGRWLVLGPGSRPGLPRQRVEFGLLVLLMLCRKATHQPVQPLMADFMAPEPADWHPYRMAFGCPLRFKQPANRLLIAEHDLGLPVATASSQFALQERVMEQWLERAGRLRTRFRAGAEIVRRLHLGAPTRLKVARALEMGERELEQKLEAEGTSWEKLLDEVRCEMAGAYLAEPEWSLARVPALVGYESQGEFIEACKRWFSMPPAHYRKLHQAGSRAV